MLGDAYTLEYTEIFNEELAEAVRYIAYELRNPDAAARLIGRTEDAIQERLFAPKYSEEMGRVVYAVAISAERVIVCFNDVSF